VKYNFEQAFKEMPSPARSCVQAVVMPLSFHFLIRNH
jgi:hypothetical protein